MNDKLPPTHGAYALRRESRLRSRWIEIGHGVTEKVHCPNCRHEFTFSGRHHALLDRLPTGGFTGQVTFSPVGVKPADPEPQPGRPGEND
jgi:hypothetical protein